MVPWRNGKNNWVAGNVGTHQREIGNKEKEREVDEHAKPRERLECYLEYKEKPLEHFELGVM